MVHMQFLGAAQTVTGSKYYLEAEGLKLLIDCGMFQGLRSLRQQNWQPLPIDVAAIDMVLLTHGHLDHTGYLPRLLKQGFKGRILGTAPTLAIAAIILRDSAKIHEEEAGKANKEGYSKHSPALPFYTLEEAEKAIRLFHIAELGQWTHLSEKIQLYFSYNGHILGATYITLKIDEKNYVFSGDIGRPNDLLLMDPQRPEWADYLFLESTYGNKLHPDEDVETILIELVLKTINEQGILLIPSFAVERLQLLMVILWRLYQKNRIPNIPIFIDSPMGTDVLDLFNRFPSWHKMPLSVLNAMCDHMTLISSYRDTWNTIDDPRPKIVIAGSGMITGGRILTYLKQKIDIETTTVLIVGFQSEGTRGKKLLEGAAELRIFGKNHTVKASVVHLESLSAHADQAELMTWLSDIKNIPENTFLIHGEREAMAGFKSKIEESLGWRVTMPNLWDTVQLI